MMQSFAGLAETIAGVALGALDALHIPKPSRLGDDLVLYSPRGAPRPSRMVLVAPPLLGSHGSPNVACVVRACLRRGWHCAVHDRPDDPQNVFGNTDSLVEALALAVRSVPGSFGRVGVIGMSTGSFQAARCLPALADNGASAVVLMANALTLERVDRLSPGWAVKYVCRKIASRLGVPRPESDRLGDLCAAVGVDPKELDCRESLAGARIPTLCINSANDPVVPSCVARALASIAAGNGFVRVSITRSGGHLGWVGFLGRRYAVRRALDFFYSPSSLADRIPHW
jgi:pimeloyl-ACP methyl ester carboxylesterase